VAHTVIPESATARTTVMTSLAVYESSPEVGSSRKSTLGSATSAMPMLTRLHCPPEIPRWKTDPIRTSRQSFSCSFFSSVSTRLRFSWMSMSPDSLSSAV